jgi:hypothetical protein
MRAVKAMLVVVVFLVLSFDGWCQEWHVRPVPLQTRWAKDVSPVNALREYPRPQMTRPNWTSLNGLWDYAITQKDAERPKMYNGKILVPFPIESALSGVKRALLPNKNLWYKRTFSNGLKTGERMLLHFGAVDWQTAVYVNGKEAGNHTGGYTEFTLDITDKVKSGDNELLVKVYDPTDQGIGPHGKQVLNPQNIYYTATSGIWQTVWLETVPKAYISGLTITPNVDSNFVAVTVHANGNEPVIFAYADQKITGSTNQLIRLPVPNVHLWSPDDPYLYDLTIKTKTDEVKSYFGMRKIAIQKDEKGIDRIFLNNKFTYNLGVLDQGFWPDGLYTAPTDEALAFDIKAIKAMGFNTIRKHIKVEPARWYYWADKMGMMVWQDMVNPNQGLPEGAKPEFERESAEELEQLHNYPCITTWVLFNEKWGQYDQKRLTGWIKHTDPSRIVNGHTGELLYVNEQLRSPSPDAYVDADMTDVHSYPSPMMPVKQIGKAQVVGEFGGIGLAVPGHEWSPVTGWGYIQTTAGQLAGKYETMVEDLKLLQEQGLSGSIYTQPYDVEGEENGLMTYDREFVKIPLVQLRKINSILVPTAPNIPKDLLIKNNDKTDEAQAYADELQQYLQGNRDTAFLKALASASLKQNDKTGGMAAADDYIATLKAPFSDEQVKFIVQFTKSTKDPGFALIRQNDARFKQVAGDRPLTVAEMNMIYAGEIAPLQETNASPDWEQIKAHTEKYGPPGEEIYLRARTIDALNKQDWERYKPVAKEYLDKYGDHITAQQKQALQSNLENH